MTYNMNDPKVFETMFNDLSPEEQARFFQEIGSVGPVESVALEDLGDFGIFPDDRPDEELDDLEYYGRHGYSRNAPEPCTDEDCPCDKDD